MKKIDLNIKLDKPVMDDDKKEISGIQVAINWIGTMLERSLNKPDKSTGRPTVVANLETQRKYFNVMNALDSHKDGIVEMSDDDFGFMDKTFHEAEFVIQRDINRVLVQISDLVNRAKVKDNG